MTIVNHDTGEIVETIGVDEARLITTEAKNEFRSGAAHTARGWELVERAVRGGGHVDLGYRSPGDYLHAEFDGILSGFNIAERRLAVRTMTGWGLSTRAIAPVLGVDQKTVSNDRRAGEESSSPDPRTPEARPALTDEPNKITKPTGANSIASPGVVTGIDGKTYTRPEPKAAPRKPITDQFRDRLYDLALKAESLHRLIEDDRWTQNAEKLAAAKNRNELRRINDLLEQVANAITENEVTP